MATSPIGVASLPGFASPVRSAPSAFAGESVTPRTAILPCSFVDWLSRDCKRDNRGNCDSVINYLTGLLPGPVVVVTG